MDDIYLVIIGIVIIFAAGISIYIITEDEKLPQPEPEPLPQPEPEPVVQPETEQDNLIKMNQVSRVGKGSLRPRGSNILYNVGSSTSSDDRPPSGDPPPSKPQPMLGKICGIGYHKKPHTTSSYRIAGFVNGNSQGVISRNAVPACILNPSLKTLAQR